MIVKPRARLLQMTTPDKTFVDSNVLIYAFDESHEGKRRKANRTLIELWSGDAGALSVQVLQEFYWNVTRKIRKPLAKTEARDVVDEYAIWCGVTSIREVKAALRIETVAQISFWDALIVASADQCGATRILSEDLNHGQIIAGIEIVNPFLDLE
jgi:predicted nucleic acid-binding protein